MATRLKKMSRRLKEKRRSLLSRYEDEDLHQLRVGLRRMRGQLKRRPGGKARRLRRDLASLADSTNDARDWDTLVARARETLPSPDFARVQTLLQTHQFAAHQRVERMLLSRKWSRTTRRWKKYTHKKPPDSGFPRDPHATIKSAMQAVHSARRRALALESTRGWHKLRIAIKDLRYTLETVPKRSRDARLSNMLKLSKRLQEELGAWHDTVVHRQLLQQLLENPGLAGDDQSRTILSHLCQQIELESDNLLRQIRSNLASIA